MLGQEIRYFFLPSKRRVFIIYYTSQIDILMCVCAVFGVFFLHSDCLLSLYCCRKVYLLHTIIYIYIFV